MTFDQSVVNIGGDIGAAAAAAAWRSATFSCALCQSANAFASLSALSFACFSSAAVAFALASCSAADAAAVMLFGGGFATAAVVSGVTPFGGGLTGGFPVTLLSALACGDADLGILFDDDAAEGGGDLGFAPADEVRGDLGGRALFFAL